MPYQTVFDVLSMSEFWGNVRWFLFFAAPLVMIMFALGAVHLLTSTIIPAVFPNRRDKKDDDDDYDVYRY